MPRHWLNNKEPDENGDYCFVIETDTGARVSTFKGKTLEEVVEKIAESQEVANKEISRLRKPDAARSPLRLEPKQLSPADRERLASDITDPERVVEAVEEIVTARQGISPDKLGKKFYEMDQNAQDQFYRDETTAFLNSHPEYYPCDQNRQAIYDELEKTKWAYTRNNLALIYQTLKERGDTVPWPAEEQAEAAPPYPNGNGQTAQPAPIPRPRSVATGIRARDAHATAPVPIKRAKYTRADIERMSRAEYNEKLRQDPDFRRQVDAMGA